MKSVVIIPSYCPDNRLIRLVQKLHKLDINDICIVNDGSGEQYFPIFNALRNIGCIVVDHEVNKGKGMAIKTGINYVVNNMKDVQGIVTADADGQHKPEDILRVCNELENHPQSIVMGVRNFDDKAIPFRSRIGNKFSSLYFKFNTGVSCQDTQTGLRGIPRQYFSEALTIEGDRYEYEMKFLTIVAKEGTPLIFVPIETIYEDKNSSSHFRPIVDSIRIYGEAVKYCCASMLCSLADISMFWALCSVRLPSIVTRVFFATIAARIISGILNFFINRNWCFKSKRAVGIQAVRYSILFVLQMLMSSILVTALSSLSLPLVLTKIIVDSGLFVFSYFVQANWVFAGSKNKIKRCKDEKLI